MTVVDLLEDARKTHGHNYSQAARTIGTTYVTYKAWRRGQVPSLRWVKSIAEYTGRDEVEVRDAIVGLLIATEVTRAVGVYVASWLAA